MDQGWIDRVRAAEQAGNGPELARLFALAVSEEGREGASRAWLAAISAYDADAITG